MTFVPLGGHGNIFPTYLQNVSADTTLDADGEKLAIVGHVPKSGTCTKIGFLTSTITTGGNLTVTIEDVDLTNGQPDGSLYVANASGVVAVADADDSIGKFCEINSGTGVAVTKGDLVAVVITAPAAFNGKLRKRTQSVGTFPYAIEYTGGVWTKSASNTPIVWVIDGVIYGFISSLHFAVSTLIYGASDHSPLLIGNAYTFPYKVSVEGCCVYCANSTTDFALYVYDYDGVTVKASKTFDKDVLGGTNGYVWWHFDTPLTFDKDQEYRVVLYPLTTTHIETWYDLWFDDGSVSSLSDDGHLGANVHYTSSNSAPGALTDWTNYLTRRHWSFLVVGQIDFPMAGGGGLILI